MRKIHVNTSHPYDITIGSSILEDCGEGIKRTRLHEKMVGADVFSVKSPDGNIEAKIETGNALSLSIFVDGKLVGTTFSEKNL